MEGLPPSGGLVKGQLKDWISPRGLIDLVQNTAPFLFRGNGALLSGPGFEYLAFLREIAGDPPSELDLTEYFRLCLSAHFATAATFVPTDVDTKIRGLIWRESRDQELLRSMCDFAIGAADWDLSPVSKRLTLAEGFGPVSGHNGEWLSVMTAAHGRFLSVGDEGYASKTGEAIDHELAREAAAFSKVLSTPGSELDTLRLAASLTHNCGDIDQAISFWPKGEVTQASRRRLHRLAHENREPYGGVFQIAASLYRDAMAAEGHRHYPLRAPRALRQNADLLLPLGPFFDDWGAAVAQHPSLALADRSEVVSALINGCNKVPNQQGYQRALAGFATAAPNVFEQAVEAMPSSARRSLKGLRQPMAVPRVSFESMMSKKVLRYRTARNELGGVRYTSV